MGCGGAQRHLVERHASDGYPSFLGDWRAASVTEPGTRGGRRGTFFQRAFAIGLVGGSAQTVDAGSACSIHSARVHFWPRNFTRALLHTFRIHSAVFEPWSGDCSIHGSSCWPGHHATGRQHPQPERHGGWSSCRGGPGRQ